MLIPPPILARLQHVPTRLFAALLTFGLMLGVPAVLGFVGAMLLALDLVVVGVLAMILAGVVFIAVVVTMWVLLFNARSRLKRAEAALYAGDFDVATREAHAVVRSVFRADYQMGALFTLALAAERLGAFPEAGTLFGRTLAMVPAFAAKRPGRRARALFCAHAALDFAAANDLLRASAMLQRGQFELGSPDRPGALDMLMDDSYMGAVGVNTMLVELENRRDPRPLFVLAWSLWSLKAGQAAQALATLANERQVLAYGLAPHEQALAARLEADAMRIAAGGGPMRALASMQGAAGWEDLVLG